MSKLDHIIQDLDEEAPILGLLDEDDLEKLPLDECEMFQVHPQEMHRLRKPMIRFSREG